MSASDWKSMRGKRLWRVRQGRSEMKLRADTHAQAKERAAMFGMEKPTSIVLIEEANKNPKPFGKRKTSHKAFKPRDPKRSPQFGKRKLPPRPSANMHVVRGVTVGGKHYYYTGLLFDTDKKKAARFDAMQAQRVMEKLERVAPKALKYLDVTGA